MSKKTPRVRDPKRTMKDRKRQDWALWCKEWRIGAKDRKRGKGVRPYNDNRLTWAQTAYLSGYLYGGEPKEEVNKILYERAWGWMDNRGPDANPDGGQAAHEPEGPAVE